jgi:HNH endonuclease
MYLTECPLQPDVLRPYMGGNKLMNRRGYIYELCPEHLAGDGPGYVGQHRLVYERHYGFYLRKTTVIHHINGEKDDNRLENLQPYTWAEHMALHRAELRSEKFPRLTHELVREALQKTKNLKKAAALVGCSHSTIQNLFPDLAEPHKRKSPIRIDDPKIISEIRLCAASPLIGFRETAQKCGIHWQTVRRICEKNQIVWVHRLKNGVDLKTSRRKKAIPAASAPCVSVNESAA